MSARAYVALMFLALVWSGSFSLIKIAVESIPPMTMAAARLAIAAALLLAVVYAGGQRLPGGWRAWAVFSVVGALGNALPFSLIAFGEQSVDSALAAILMGIMPVATALLAHLSFADERLSLRRALGVALGFCGVATLVGWDALAGLGEQLIGQLAVLGGALCYALTTLFVRRFGRYPNRVIAAGATLSGALLMTPAAVLIEQPWRLEPTAGAVGAVIVLGVLPTGVASLVFFWLVRTVGAANFAQVNYVIPALGVVWGMLVLGEQPSPQALAALALILSGVWLVTSRRAVG